MKISVVAPVFNEQDSLKQLHEQISALGAVISEIVYVNDGSTDASSAILAEIAGKDNRVKVVNQGRNRGQTAALAAGFAAASGEWIVTLDADLQNDPADIPALIAKANEGWDVVSGWRKDRNDPYFSKVLPSHIANSLISCITGLSLHDYGCTLKIYRAACVKNLSMYGEMHRFLVAYCAWEGAKVTEIVVRHHRREHGISHYGWERVFKVVLDLLAAKYFLSYSSKPMYIFGGVALVSAAMSIAAALFVIIRKIWMGGLWMSPMILIAFFMASVSVVCLLLGFIAEQLTRIYFETRRKNGVS